MNPSVPPEADDDDFDLDDLLDGINRSSPAAASDKSDDSEAATLRRMIHQEEEEEDETEDALSLKAESRMDEEEEEESDDDIWLQAIETLDMEEDPPDLRTNFQSLPLDDSLPDLPAEPIPASVAELMNRQPRWVYLSNPKNTKEIFEAMILEASEETEFMAPPPIKVINEVE